MAVEGEFDTTEVSPAVAVICGHAGVELPVSVTDVHVPHEAAHLEKGWWLPERNPPSNRSQFAEGCTRGPGVGMGMGRPEQ